MTDDDLLTEIRGRLEPARMTVPLDTVVNRGHARRRRRRILAAAEVAVGVAAAAAITVAALPGPVTGTTTDRLAAWSVTSKADSVVRVEMHSLRDLPQLQAAMRAHGAHVFVVSDPSDGGGPALWCPYGIAPDSVKVPPGWNEIGGFTLATSGTDTSGLAQPLTAPGFRDDDLYFAIRTDMIPAGYALEIILSPVAEPHGQTAVDQGDQLVTSSGQCMPGWHTLH
jgi:hypothetical protein